MPTLVLSTWVGSVPSMNHSLTVFAEKAPASSGEGIHGCLHDARHLLEGCDWLALRGGRENDCQSDAADSSETTPAGGAELSELPIQAPTTKAGAFGSFGGARNPWR